MSSIGVRDISVYRAIEEAEFLGVYWLALLFCMQCICLIYGSGLMTAAVDEKGP